MLKFGFEREFFIRSFSTRDLTIVPKEFTIAPDACGFLVEARSDPFPDPREAAYNLQFKVALLRAECVRLGLIMDESLDTTKLDRKVKQAARRLYAKGTIAYQNLSGKMPGTWDTAGTHVTVSRESSIAFHAPACKCGRTPAKSETHRFTQCFDYPQFIRLMDREFSKEIKAAKRVPGFYEIKSDGRVEYRSLPMSVDIHRVASFLKANVKVIHGSLA